MFLIISGRYTVSTIRNGDHFMNHVDIKTDNALEKHGYEPIKSVSLREGTPFMDKGTRSRLTSEKDVGRIG